jgi:hypothetical protein
MMRAILSPCARRLRVSCRPESGTRAEGRQTETAGGAAGDGDLPVRLHPGRPGSLRRRELCRPRHDHQRRAVRMSALATAPREPARFCDLTERSNCRSGTGRRRQPLHLPGFPGIRRRRPSGAHRKTFDIWAADGIALNTNTIDPQHRRRRQRRVCEASQSGRHVADADQRQLHGPRRGAIHDPLQPRGLRRLHVRGRSPGEREQPGSIEARRVPRGAARLAGPERGGKRGPTDEGFYLMPFRLTVTVP